MNNGKSIYEHIHPKKFFREHVLQGVRPDGRKLLGYRPVALNVNIVSKADSSATLKVGSSVFICGINAEISLVRPDTSVFVTVSCPTMQPCENDTENISDKLALCSNLITQIFKYRSIIDPASLKTPNEKVFWVLYCDVLCTNYDGALMDGTLMVLAAALKTLKIPKVVFINDSDDFYVDTKDKELIDMGLYPIATTYGIFENSVILVDPSNKEEQLCCLSQVTMIAMGNEICAIHKHGAAAVPNEIMIPCMTQALKRSPLVVKIIDAVLTQNK